MRFCLGHMIRIPSADDLWDMFQTCITCRKPQGRHKTCRRGDNSQMTWVHYSVSTGALEAVTGEGGVHWSDHSHNPDDKVSYV